MGIGDNLVDSNIRRYSMEYEESMKYVNDIWEHLRDADEKVKDAFSTILDGYEQWSHL